MSYWGLNAIFLAIAGAIGIVALVTRLGRRRVTGRDRRRVVTLASCALAVVILLVMTAVFDNVMIGIGLVGYDPAKISHVFVGIAPLEDFSYSVAALILLPSLWSLLGGRKPRGGAVGSAATTNAGPTNAGTDGGTTNAGTTHAGTTDGGTTNAATTHAGTTKTEND